jgi:putative DNA methylase
MTCAAGHHSSILAALDGRLPRRRMYAKVVKLPGGQREYRAIDAFDLDLYDRASKLLANAPDGQLVLPDGMLEAGANTAQALNWGYQSWASFFNDRQLYTLGRIGAALRDLPGHSPEREALVAAFGKTLEHHNLFCSFKGEGTGPVRSIFHNHVLRPERCSVEGNPWGADGGSGGYAETLDRLRRAHSYKEAPADLVERNGAVRKVTGRSAPISRPVVTAWARLRADQRAAYIATGDAAATDLPDGSVALVVTDPPYVDNVHYSELADFFHSWMRLITPYPEYPQTVSTRDQREVQNRTADGFHEMIVDVWRECRRVLRDDGLLVFSFHQARTSGWAAVMSSLAAAGFVVTATRPVVAEVTTSLTKSAANEPNRIDVIVACRKAAAVPAQSPARARAAVMRALNTLAGHGVALGPGDVRSAVRAAVLGQGTRLPAPDWGALQKQADEQAERAVAAFLSR